MKWTKSRKITILKRFDDIVDVALQMTELLVPRIRFSIEFHSKFAFNFAGF